MVERPCAPVDPGRILLATIRFEVVACLAPSVLTLLWPTVIGDTQP